MKKKNSVAIVYEMYYTSMWAFFIFAVLNNYISASKETMKAGTENTTVAHDFRILTPQTWLRGFDGCKLEGNYTMAPSINRMGLVRRVRNSLPLWIYAFEVRHVSSGNVFRIQRSDVSDRLNTYFCLKNVGTSSPMYVVVDKGKSYKEATMYCANINCSLPDIYANNVTRFSQEIWINTSYWVRYLNEALFLTDYVNYDLSVKCFLLDKDGQIRTEDCRARHNTLCLRGTASDTQPVVHYVGQVTIPQYIHTTTNTRSADPWMDPQIQYVVITVCSVIVLAILVAICCCCCRKRIKNSKSADLAGVYSETADSIAMKEGSVYETPDISEYAVPEDAVKKARQRESIGENEYDVISKAKNKTPTKYIGNAYSHVAVVSSNDRRVSPNQDENAYDVPNFGKQHTVLLTPNDTVGNVYGQVEVKMES